MKFAKLPLTALIAVLVMASSVALGQQNPSFEEMDRDEDGLISSSEAMALPCLARVFDEIEKEDDAGLNRNEFNTAVQQHCQRSQSQGQGQGDDDWPES
ncbi:MAG: hypothetical protein ACOCSR_03790 [Wenzhouxiangella sp.]